MPRISPIPAFDDNYLWLIEHGNQQSCAIVDPGDADPVINTIKEKGLNLEYILITHKHGDHVGGIKKLKQHWPDAVVYGPKNEPIADLEIRLTEGDIVDLQKLNLKFEVLDVPGHTEGHIAYYGHGVLFCGDTLFAGGCGRVFSGTHAQLSQSLQKIAALPGDTLAYCAHEYTLANLGFAKWVEPDSQALLQRHDQDSAKREQNQPTVPFTIATELETNPFMRTDKDQVIQAGEQWIGKTLAGRDEVFHAIREWKDKDYD